MVKYSVLVSDPEKYKQLVGVEKQKDDLIEHDKQDILELIKEKAIIIPELTKRKLEKQKALNTPDENGNQTPEDILATRITTNTNFPELCRQAVKQIGIYFDEFKYWWIWNEAEYKWQETDDTTILNKIDSKITESANTIESKIKSMLLEALKREGRKNKPEELDWHWIQFKDKLINFSNGQTIPATSKYFIANPIPWKVGKTTETPNLDKLLDEWLNNSKTKKRNINYLKELFAFTIAPKYFISSVPFLYGAGSDGKSQFIRTLIKFIGMHNYTSTNLSYLEKSQFGTYSLRKKLLCTVNELPKNQIDNFTTIKAISGRDPIFMEKKGHDRLTDIVYSKIFLVGNDVPICSDMSDGFTRRIILLKFPNQFKEGGDIFESIPEEEFENLAFWCLNKLKELEKTYSLKCDHDDLITKKEEYKKASNQVIHFMKSVGYIITGKMEHKVMVTQWFNEYNRWAEDNHHDLLDYKNFKAKIENLGVSTDNDDVVIGDQRTRRLFAYGVEKQVIMGDGS
jgi:P4 family phage/plasmid primase-like protien